MIVGASTIVFLCLCLKSSGTKMHLCDSPQYAELGEPRIINCHIEESILVLSWYNSTDYVNDYPLIFVSENMKGGSGFLSKEYDIFPNGSLIINKVSLKHDHVFTISVLLEKLSEPIVNMVEVIVTVKPEIKFPLIHSCGDRNRICFEAGNSTQFICSVTGSRPLIPLQWMQRTVHSNIKLHYESITTQNNESYSSKVTTNPRTILESNFVLLVCKADSPPGMLINDESLVLVQNNDINFSNVGTILWNTESQSDLFLVCTEYETAYFIWKRKRPTDNEFHELGYSLYPGEEHAEVFHEGYFLMKNTTLVISAVEIQHETFYGCIFGDGVSEGATLYSLNVFDPNEENRNLTSPLEFQFIHKPFLLSSFVGMLLLLLCILCGVYRLLTCRRRQAASNLHSVESSYNEEMTSMLHAEMDTRNIGDVDDTWTERHEETSSIQGKRKQLIREIKTIYNENYNAVQPIPYKKEMFGVDRVFVDGGIEFLDSTGEWQTLDSYRDIFNIPSLKSTRRFIEGDPAYGKSTLALQLAYDWCHPSKASCMSSVEIFILLRLRQFKGVKSIYEAISRFILPRDSCLSEDDVKDVLLNSKSVVIVLEGYDEYPDDNSDTDSDIAKIILRQMFQNYDVILTTRSSHLPPKYSHMTKRIRLTGFDKKARRNYIEQVISKENTKEIDEIEKYLKENPILSNICQIPLFCALFVHVANDTSDISSINTVTTVFNYAIRCFHSHMKNKMTEENVPITHVRDRKKFYEVAFRSLTKENSKISWTKRELCNEIGIDLYSEYVKIGILVEEEMVPTFDGDGSLNLDYNQCSAEVRFYHKLFCEWYAAYHVTKNCSPASLNDLLLQLDPFDVQYVFRFSCGLDTYCANLIVNFLKRIEGGSKFAILCFLEIPDTKEDMKEIIRSLCNSGLVIAGSDSLLLQQSTLQLLEIAPKIKAKIRLLGLYGSFKSLDMSRKVIILESSLEISHKLPFEDLTISFTNKTPTDEDWKNIFIFCSECPRLKELWLLDCVPPHTIPLGYSKSGLQLSSSGVNVKWRTNAKSHRDVYVLDLDKGQWKLAGGTEFLKIQQFNKMRQIHNKKRKQRIEDNKKQVENIRETLRTATHIDTSDRRMEAIRDEIE